MSQGLNNIALKALVICYYCGQKFTQF